MVDFLRPASSTPPVPDSKEAFEMVQNSIHPVCEVQNFDFCDLGWQMSSTMVHLCRKGWLSFYGSAEQCASSPKIHKACKGGLSTIYLVDTVIFWKAIDQPASQGQLFCFAFGFELGFEELSEEAKMNGYNSDDEDDTPGGELNVRRQPVLVV